MSIDALDLVSRLATVTEGDNVFAMRISADEAEYLLRAVARSIWIDRMRDDLDKRERPEYHAMRSCLDMIDANAKVTR